jgi:hypothetical protein
MNLPETSAASAGILALLLIMSGTSIQVQAQSQAQVQAQAQAQEAGTGQGIRIQQVAASAQKEARSVRAAAEAYEAVARAVADDAAWKKVSARLEGSWKGNFLEEPGAGPNAGPITAGASLNLPVLSSTALSLTVTGQASLVPESQPSAGASIAWSPLAVDNAGLKSALSLQQAGIALDAARKEAALSAMGAFMDTISAEASRDASKAALERARTALTRRQAEAARGELGAAALARARAAVPKAEATYNKNIALAANKRRLLAEQAGGSIGAAISAGAVLDLASINTLTQEAWVPPASPGPSKAVLSAQAALAKEEATSWFGEGTGPLTLSASVSTTGAFSLAGAVNLDYKTLSARHFSDRQDRLANAREALDEALEAQSLAREQALVDAEIASLSLIEAEATAVAANLDLAQAQVLHRLGELLPDELAEAEEKSATANLAVILSRLELAKARLALE